jgi:hypothetical protein
VRFIAINDDFDTNSDMDNGVSILLPLKNIINEAYALDIGRKIKSQRQQAIKSGEYLGTKPPYGYIKSPDNCHKLIIDPEAAEVVRTIFQWAYEGVGTHQIILRLKAAKIEPPNIYSKRKEISNSRNLSDNDIWTSFVVNKLLSNEIYTGDMVQGKTQRIEHKQVDISPDKWIIVPNTHEPIISRQMWNSVSEQRKLAHIKAKARIEKPYTENIFKGKIFCGQCKSPLHRHRRTRKKTCDFYSFYCPTNLRMSTKVCETHNLPETELISTLLSLIEKNSDVIAGKALRLRKEPTIIEARRERMKLELSALRLDADKTGRMQKSLYESLVMGLITADEYKDMHSGYDSKMQTILSKIMLLETEQMKFNKQVNTFFEFADLLKMVKTNGLTATLIDLLVNRIMVYEGRTIEVDFSFESFFDLIMEAGGDE